MLVQRFGSPGSVDQQYLELARFGRKPGPVVFLDRDGVINANRASHVTSWDDFAFLPGALEAIALLTRNGWRIVVVTNQAAINRGQLAATELDHIHGRMAAEIRSKGGELLAVYACPHRPDEGCRCRKPEPGLILAAAREHGASRDDSFLIGDHQTDAEAGRRAGFRSIIVLSGRFQDLPSEAMPENCVALVPDLLAAARLLSRPKAEHPIAAGHEGSTVC